MSSENYLAGTIDQWFFQAEGLGVVFIMNAANTAEAHEILKKLPLGVAGMMAPCSERKRPGEGDAPARPNPGRGCSSPRVNGHFSTQVGAHAVSRHARRHRGGTVVARRSRSCLGWLRRRGPPFRFISRLSLDHFFGSRGGSA